MENKLIIGQNVQTQPLEKQRERIFMMYDLANSFNKLIKNITAISNYKLQVVCLCSSPSLKLFMYG